MRVLRRPGFGAGLSRPGGFVRLYCGFDRLHDGFDGVYNGFVFGERSFVFYELVGFVVHILLFFRF